MYRALVVFALLVPAAACASAQAKTSIEPVSLDVPAVPPRVVETVTIEPPPAPPVEEPPQPPVTPVTSKPRPPRDPSRSSTPEPKPDPDPEPAVSPVAPPVPPLRTGSQSASTDEARRQITDIIQRARLLLEPMDTRGMSADRLANYESAKDSILRAETALRASNLVFARQSAERAENIAKQLGSRQIPD